MRRVVALAVCVAVFALPGVFAQDKKKPDKKDTTTIRMAIPPGVSPGAKSVTVVLRGKGLDGAKEVRASVGTAKLLRKGKVGVPEKQDAAKVGDSHADIEVLLPGDAKGESLTLTVVTATGEAMHAVLIDRDVDKEKEPNDGFKQANELKVGRWMHGTIDRSQDVDLYRFEGKVGQKVVIETSADKLGSAADIFLTLYDGEGRIVATDDDSGGGTDARIETTLKTAGVYYVGVTESHDQGGVTHWYRVRIK